MKHLIILLFFGLVSCHVHYHIEPKEQPIKTNCDNHFYPIGKQIYSDGCGVHGCAVYHVGTSYINNLKLNK